MRVLAMVHEDDAGPGVFNEAAAERGVEIVEWYVPEQPEPADAREGYDGAVVLGGSQHPDHEDEHPYLRGEKRLIADLLAADTPILGVCLGAELVAEVTGGSTVQNSAPHIGWTESTLTEAGREDPVFGALPERFHCFQWHSYSCVPAAGGVTLAVEDSQLDAFRIGDAWGIQFHAEVNPEIIGGWMNLLDTHEEAVEAGFDAGPGREETARRIAESGEVGRALFGAFVDQVRTRDR